MQCDDIYMLLISGHIDGTNSETEEKRLEQHLKQCRHCRELLAVLEAHDAQLSQGAAEPPADLSARIMEAVRKEPKRKPRKKRLYTSLAAAGLATAAMLCFALMGDWLSLPESEDHASFYNANVTNDAAVSPVVPPESSELSPDASEQPPANDAETPESASPDDNLSRGDQPDEKQPTSSEASPRPSGEPENDSPDESMEPLVLPSVTEEDGLPAEDTPSDVLSPNGLRRPITADKSLRCVPTLVIWGASAQELSPLSDMSPDRLAAFKSVGNSADLYSRFFSALFSGRQNTLDESNGKLLAALDTDIYRVPYSTLQELFELCWGDYEIAIYLPREISAQEPCQIILVLSEQENSELPVGNLQ